MEEGNDPNKKPAAVKGATGFSDLLGSESLPSRSKPVDAGIMLEDRKNASGKNNYSHVEK